MKYKISIVFFVFSIITMNCVSQTYYVDSNGLGDFNDIQSAINDANDNDIIIVRPSIYIENINTLGKAITLQSTVPEDPEIISTTVIDGNDSGTCITCDSRSRGDVVISGFLITKGGESNGGGMYCANGSCPVVKNCFFVNNDATYGGGIYCENGGNAEILNCSFRYNTCSRNGGAIYIEDSDPEITNCIFYKNNAYDDYFSDYGQGGGIYLADSNSTISHCSFTFNQGNAIYNSWYDGKPQIINCEFCNNGYVAVEGNFAEISNCNFIGNKEEGGYGCGFGGEASKIRNCTFQGNLGSGILGGADSIENCKFIANRATTGAGICNCINSAIKNCTFKGNLAGDGAALAVRVYDWYGFPDEVHSTIEDCIFYGNKCTDYLMQHLIISGVAVVSHKVDYESSAYLTAKGSLLCSNMPNKINRGYINEGGNIAKNIYPDVQPLKGDFDNNGQVDANDLNQLAQDWLN